MFKFMGKSFRMCLRKPEENRMRNFFLIFVLLSVAIFITSCSKPEETTISKYFQAMDVGDEGDRDTMTSMAIHPKYIKFDSYEIVSIGESVVKPIVLPELNKQLVEIDKQRKDIRLSAQEADDAVFDLEDEIADERSASKKRELNKKLDDAKAKKAEVVLRFKNLIKQKKDLEKRIEFEKSLMKTSSGRSKMPNIDMYSGNSHTSKVDVKITLPSKEIVDYVFILKKYVLKLNEKELPRNRYLITEITTAEDYAKSIDKVSEENNNVEEVAEETESTEKE